MHFGLPTFIGNASAIDYCRLLIERVNSAAIIIDRVRLWTSNPITIGRRQRANNAAHRRHWWSIIDHQSPHRFDAVSCKAARATHSTTARWRRRNESFEGNFFSLMELWMRFLSRIRPNFIEWMIHSSLNAISITHSPKFYWMNEWFIHEWIKFIMKWMEWMNGRFIHRWMRFLLRIRPNFIEWMNEMNDSFIDECDFYYAFAQILLNDWFILLRRASIAWHLLLNEWKRLSTL